MQACRYGLVDQLHYLIKTGVNVNVADFVSGLSTCEGRIMYMNSRCMHVYCQYVGNRWRIQSWDEPWASHWASSSVFNSTSIACELDPAKQATKLRMCEHQAWLPSLIRSFQSQHCWAPEQAWYRHIAWFTSLDSLWFTLTWLTKTYLSIRPGKLDFFLYISHLLDLHAGGRSLFIISYQ